MCKGGLLLAYHLSLQHLCFQRTGEELDAFLERHKPDFDRIIYVGDGSNDYCPVVRLRRFVNTTY